jgi:hypothetical protein
MSLKKTLPEPAVMLFFELHSRTQTLTTRSHTHPYEYTYANPPMSTSEGLSTGRSGDSGQFCITDPISTLTILKYIYICGQGMVPIMQYSTTPALLLLFILGM